MDQICPRCGCRSFHYNRSRMRVECDACGHALTDPQELQLLKHAASKKLLRVQPHLKDIPEYLVPEALKPKVTIREESNKRERSGSQGGEWKRKKVDDPLHVRVASGREA